MPLLAFIVLSAAVLLGAWFIIGEIVSGQASAKAGSFNRADEPGAYWLAILTKVAFVVFAVAVLLNALGLTGDPYVWLHGTFPAFFRH